MAIINSAGRLRGVPSRPTAGPTLAVGGALATTIMIIAAVQRALPAEALLPLSAGLLFLFAALVTLLALLRPTTERQFTYWDAAGALTAIGVVAAAGVEPEQMVRLVAGAEH